MLETEISNHLNSPSSLSRYLHTFSLAHSSPPPPSSLQELKDLLCTKILINIEKVARDCKPRIDVEITKIALSVICHKIKNVESRSVWKIANWMWCLGELGVINANSRENKFENLQMLFEILEVGMQKMDAQQFFVVGEILGSAAERDLEFGQNCDFDFSACFAFFVENLKTRFWEQKPANFRFLKDLVFWFAEYFLCVLVRNLAAGKFLEN